jgi:hypothetical protein
MKENIKIAVFCNIMSCHQVDDYQLFRGTYCFNLQGTSYLKMEAVYSSVTITIHQITQHQMPEACSIKTSTLTIMPNFKSKRNKVIPVG